MINLTNVKAVTAVNQIIVVIIVTSVNHVLLALNANQFVILAVMYATVVNTIK